MQTTAFSAYERMSPFEIKDELIRLARSADRKGTRVFLDADNNARRLKTLKGFTPYEFICRP